MRLWDAAPEPMHVEDPVDLIEAVHDVCVSGRTGPRGPYDGSFDGSLTVPLTSESCDSQAPVRCGGPLGPDSVSEPRFSADLQLGLERTARDFRTS